MGRVGGLAVALGIGAALASGHGIAHADSGADAKGSPNNDTSQSKPNDQDQNSESGQVDTPGQPESPGSTATGQSAQPQNPLISTRRWLTSLRELAPDRGSLERKPRISTRSDGSSSRNLLSGNLVGAKNTDETTTKPRHSVRFNRTEKVESQTDTNEAEGSKSGAQPAVTAKTTTTSDNPPEVEVKQVQQKQVQEKTTTLADLPKPTAAVDTAQRAVTTVLTTLDDTAPAPATPAPSTPPVTLTDVLGWAWREISRTFFNQSPTIGYTPATNKVLPDGAIEGYLHTNGVRDPDSERLTYTATDPSHGDVVVHPDGTFTYTPDDTFVGSDSFVVTISDARDGFHIHGLSGLVNLLTFGLLGESGHTVTKTINVGDVQSGYTVVEHVTGLTEPTDFRVLPDGRILIVEKAGAIRVADKDGNLQATPVAKLDTPTKWARGLLAVEIDPEYETNGYIYVSYVEPTTGHERLSRLTVTDPNAEVLTIDLDSEKVLVEGTEAAGDDHLGGGLAFGPDGKLYWAVGDNVCCTHIDGSRSQDSTTIYGKVLRLNPDGTAPEDNPFYDEATGVGQLIYARGFRNPFRLAFAPDGELLVTDVGQATWEEVNLIRPGGNYGWPEAEGPCDGIGTQNCSKPSSYDNPIYAYKHTNGGNSITGVLVSSDPEAGTHTVLIADFNQGWVKELTFNSDYSQVIGERILDAAGPGSTNQLIRDEKGNIYQLTYQGTLWRLTPSSDVSVV
ncbi:PQQ-dependent sugar dehydrogenase [Mycolicibacterium agri]|uniref:PQQ-dependent sugar dehydrogenase n=1 Tax=Mycolicibacterium agri TaxID=36811 RepID=UPI000D6B1D9F|nr:PQQ-dependent sugar dehydrogenase [Mycolicibacterium agri]